MSTLTGLASSAFARHYLRNHFCFLFLRLLRCFSSAGLRLYHAVFNCIGFPIRTSADQGSFAPPRRFSQLTTSFVASGSQGIPHAPLFRFHLFPCTTYHRTSSFFFFLLFLAALAWLDFTFLLFCFSFPPSLVNELFVPFYPLSKRKSGCDSLNTRGRVQLLHKLDSNQSLSPLEQGPRIQADVDNS